MCAIYIWELQFAALQKFYFIWRRNHFSNVYLRHLLAENLIAWQRDISYDRWGGGCRLHNGCAAITTPINSNYSLVTRLCLLRWLSELEAEDGASSIFCQLGDAVRGSDILAEILSGALEKYSWPYLRNTASSIFCQLGDAIRASSQTWQDWVRPRKPQLLFTILNQLLFTILK